MSSPAAHLAMGVFVGTRDRRAWTLRRGLWVAWLAFVAAAPDLDYVVSALAAKNFENLRITHSLLFALALPLLSVATIALGGSRGRVLAVQGLEVACAGASHLLLDLAVAVMKLPLFWPFLRELYHSPVGLLPSVALPGSSVFLRNLALEALVLVPLCALLGLAFRRRLGRRRTVSVICLVVMLMGMFSCACLERH